jgi:hypothetical protein
MSINSNTLVRKLNDINEILSIDKDPDKLTLTQKQHIQSIRWLLDPTEHIGEGRSKLLAITFIEMAIRNPNGCICVYDHFQGHNQIGRSNMLKIIKSIMDDEYPDLKDWFKITNDSIIFIKDFSTEVGEKKNVNNSRRS